MSILSVPSKVFLLGEYGVLAGLPALLATLSLRFEGRVSQDRSGEVSSESPLGRLQTLLKTQGVPIHAFEFCDPFLGSGGFGASTAQFLLGYSVNALKRDWRSAWQCYRHLMQAEITPSGVDLVCQYLGGVLQWMGWEQEPQDVSTSLDWSSWLIFSATHQQGRKTLTHHHLKGLKLEPEMLLQLKVWMDEGMIALQQADLQRLGVVLNGYANVLAQWHLEDPRIREDRFYVQKHSQVLGVKGMGAFQSDGLIVLLKPGASSDEVIQSAQDRGLVLVQKGLGAQPGLQWDSF